MTTASYQLTLDQLLRMAPENSTTRQQIADVLEQTLAEHGFSPQKIGPGDMQDLLFPHLDRALALLVGDDGLRQGTLRRVGELLIAQELGAVFGAGADAPIDDDELDLDDEEHEASPEEDDDFDIEDEVGPSLGASSRTSPRYNLSSEAEQSRLIADLGRVSGVQSVMICRHNGEVLMARSLTDTSRLGGVVAATIMLLRNQKLRLMSAHVGQTIMCVRPFGDCAVAVLAQPSANVGRLLTELSQIEAINS